MGTIRAVVFDMDGVLVDAREWHYEALNRALGIFGETIQREEHLSTFDGLPTRTKLELLSRSNRVPRALHDFLNTLKQKFTMELVATRCRPVFAHQYALSRLRKDGYKLAVASNSVRETVRIMMERTNLMPYLDFCLSNEDVEKPKPHPEIYRTAIKRLGFDPGEVVAVEDNEHGLEAARASGARVMRVGSAGEVDYTGVRAFIDREERTPCST